MKYDEMEFQAIPRGAAEDRLVELAVIKSENQLGWIIIASLFTLACFWCPLAVLLAKAIIK